MRVSYIFLKFTHTSLLYCLQCFQLDYLVDLTNGVSGPGHVTNLDINFVWPEKVTLMRVLLSWGWLSRLKKRKYIKFICKCLNRNRVWRVEQRTWYHDRVRVPVVFRFSSSEQQSRRAKGCINKQTSENILLTIDNLSRNWQIWLFRS